MSHMEELLEQLVAAPSTSRKRKSPHPSPMKPASEVDSDDDAINSPSSSELPVPKNAFDLMMSSDGASQFNLDPIKELSLDKLFYHWYDHKLMSVSDKLWSTHADTPGRARMVMKHLEGLLSPADKEALAARPSTTSSSYSAWQTSLNHIAKTTSASAMAAMATWENDFTTQNTTKVLAFLKRLSNFKRNVRPAKKAPKVSKQNKKSK